MTKQRSDSNLKDKDYRKWVEGQSTEALEKELLTLETRRTILQTQDPKIEVEVGSPESEDWEEDWDQFEARMSPKEFAEYVADMDAEFEAQEKAIARYEEIQAMEPEERTRLEAERDARLAAMEPEERARLGVIDPEVLRTPWLAELVEVTQHLKAVERELTARRIQGVSKRSKRSKRNPTVKNRREYVQAQAQDGLDAPHICETLDMAHIDLPKGADWEKYRKSGEPWADAYRLGGKKLQGRILTIFSKDKKA